MKIHVSSDIHLEFTDDFPDCPVADVGIFAGDIGLICDPKRLLSFFSEMQERYEHIIWVLGNHEYYHLDYMQALKEAIQIAKIADIHLLDINTDPNIEIDGVTFWGSTLWMDFNGGDWFAKRAVGKGLNDFTDIKVNDRTLSVLDVEGINKQTREAINWDADVVITHHAPIYVPHPRFALQDLSWGFYNTGLEDQIINSDIKLWLYGHTHYSADFELAGTRVVANCHGFNSRYSLSESSNYDPDLIIEI